MVHEPEQMRVEEGREGFLRSWRRSRRDADVDEALGRFDGDRVGPSARIRRP